MAKTSAEHHRDAANHLESATEHHRAADKAYSAGDHKTGAHEAQCACGHSSQANHHATLAAENHLKHDGMHTEAAASGHEKAISS